MAEKISTIILKVDLDCHKCYKKLRKILCCLQDQERIRTISYDNKSGTITIVGPFDPHKLSCKIRCKGGKLIKGVLIMDGGGGGGKPVKMPPGPPPERKKPKAEPMAMPMPQPVVAEPPQQQQPAEEKAPPRMDKYPLMPPPEQWNEPEQRPAELDPPPMKGKPMPIPIDLPVEIKKPTVRPLPPPVDVTPTMVEIPSWPAPPVVGQTGPCGCSCCTPCYQGYYEGCRSCHCGGRVYGYYAAGQPPAECYGGAYRGCRIVNEEDPTACSIM